MQQQSTFRTGYLHFNLMNLDRVARTLIIEVKLSEQSARDVCSFINLRKDYGLTLGDCWLSNVEGGEAAGVESLSCVQMRVGGDSYSTNFRTALGLRQASDDAQRSRN